MIFYKHWNRISYHLNICIMDEEIKEKLIRAFKAFVVLGIIAIILSSIG